MKVLTDWLTGDRETQELVALLDPRRIPAHIAIIMDGNGRWANRRGLPRIAGHRAGVSPVRETVEACARMGVGALTLYAFSVENWKRPRAEVDTLWRLLRFYLRRELPELNRNGVVLRVIGRVDELPGKVREEIDYAEERTRDNGGMRLNLAINYGGRAELVDAINAAVDEARRAGTLDSLRFDEESVSNHLYTADVADPDLLIRTSGEMRVSNFLLWQIAYAELYVTETLWPDFNKTELLRAVLDYQKRERRFGGLGKRAVAEMVVPSSEEANDNEWLEETVVSSQ
jgi:undecaprenyl diphosphate synthase